MGMAEGGDPEDWENALPPHRVTVSAFCLAKTEVTQSDWSRLMKTNPSQFRGERRPVEQVSWNDAVLYCNVKSVGGHQETDAFDPAERRLAATALASRRR